MKPRFLKILYVCLFAGILTGQVAQYPGGVATESHLKKAANNLQTTLRGRIAAGDTLITVADASRITADMLLTIDSEIVSVSAVNGNVLTVVRGFDGTTAAAHNGGRTVSGFIDAWHFEALKKEVQAIQSALGPGLANVNQSGPSLNAATYDWSRTPGGSLTVGVNSVTLTTCPVGVNGTDQGHWLYISGGVGAAEKVLITGGTCTTGAASGTIFFSAANTHSGGWSIQSATAGAQEAVQLITTAGGRGSVQLNASVLDWYAPLTINTDNIRIVGAGSGTQIVQNTINTDIIQVGDGTTKHNAISIENLALLNSASLSASSSGYAINCRYAGLVKITNVRVYGNTRVWRGVNVEDVIFFEIANSRIEDTVSRGMHVEGTGAAPRGNTDIKILSNTILGTGSDAIFIGDHSAAHYIFDNEIYGMQESYALRIDPGDPGNFNYFIRDNDFSTNEADGGDDAGGVFVGEYVVADLSNNTMNAATSDVRPGIRIESGGEARVVGWSHTGVGQTAIENAGALLLTSSTLNGSGTALKGVEVLSTATMSNISANQFLQYPNAPISLHASALKTSIHGNTFRSISDSGSWTGTPADMVASGNYGPETAIPAIASAATITIDNSPTINITGTTTITTINGGWNGRRIWLIKANSDPVTIGGGGNIPAARVLASYGVVTLVYASGNWY